LRALQEPPSEETLDFDWALLDQLQDLVLALKYAEAFFSRVHVKPTNLRGLLWRAARLRLRLLGAAVQLAGQAVVDDWSSRPTPRCVGDWGVGHDLLTATYVLKHAGAASSWRSPAAQPLLLLAAELRQSLPEISKSGMKLMNDAFAIHRLRGRALILLVRTYGDSRRAVRALRRNVGDAETITPSLFAEDAPAARPPKEPWS
jgi:hypothetical protein